MGLFATSCVQHHVLLMLIFQLIFAHGKAFYKLSTLLAALKWQCEPQTSPHDEGYCSSAERTGISPSKLCTNYWQSMY
jgi:hypothetical protein